MSIIQNNRVYKDLVKYFRSKVSLNLQSQVNVQNASNDIQNTSNNISNCLPLDSKPTRFYKTKNPTYFRRTTPRRFYLYKIGSHVPTAALYKSQHRLLPCRSATSKTTPTTRPKRQHAPITPARVYNANALPTNNLHKNLHSNLYNNLRNNLDLRTVPLISSNSHLFLYIYSTSFRRFSVEGDFKTLIVPKITIKVATSVI